ncbi:MAG TPA: hypothetical protein VMG39_02885 [Pseudolabrys sp.]|nr:hypothetical protein [Pseudolabrys sp.]
MTELRRQKKLNFSGRKLSFAEISARERISCGHPVVTREIFGLPVDNLIAGKSLLIKAQAGGAEGI